jgi:hypothetical protein
MRALDLDTLEQQSYLSIGITRQGVLKKLDNI